MTAKVVVRASIAPMHIESRVSSPQTSQRLAGHTVEVLEIAGDWPALPQVLATVEPTLEIHSQAEPVTDGFRAVTLTTKRDDELGEGLVRALLAQNYRVRALNRVQPTLEDVFLAATRRSWDAISTPKREPQ